jgi:hypothetical protein
MGTETGKNHLGGEGIAAIFNGATHVVERTWRVVKPKAIMESFTEARRLVLM